MTAPVAGGTSSPTIEDRLNRFVAAFNSRDRETLEAFVQEHFHPDALESASAQDRAGFYLMLGHFAGGIDLAGVGGQGDTVEAWGRSRLTGEWIRLVVSSGAGGRLRDLLPYLHSARLEPREAPLPPGRVGQELDAYIQILVAADLFSGSVLLARDGVPFFARAYGLASIEFEMPNRVDTKFNLGSMNKMFTAVAIAQLAQRGRLRFEDTIDTYLPDYPADVAGRVTIHHLLTHTSGLGDYFTDRFHEIRPRLRAVRDYFPLFADQPLRFEPGERWGYSNAGFMVLGAVVEAVAGQDYFEYVRENVYRPAGMTHTDAYETDLPTPNLAVGYTHMTVSGEPDLSVRRNNLNMHVLKGGPAGGGFSTVEDLLRFDRALRSHRLLDARHTALVMAGKVVAGGPSRMYAYGFVDERAGEERITGHSGGGFLGINGLLDMYMDSGFTVAVLSNYDAPAAERVGARARELLTRATA